MRARPVLATVAALAAGAAPALAGGYTAPAAGPVVTSPPPGVEAGRDWTGVYGGAQLGYGDAALEGPAAIKGDGAFGGVHAGYVQDFGRWILGGELAYSLGDISADGDLGRVDRMFLAKLKAGADMGNWLLYGTGGAGRYGLSTGGTDQSGNGYFLGAGATWMMNDSWMLGTEILRHWADDFDGTGIDGDMTTLGAQVSFRF